MRSLVISLLILSSLAALTQSFSLSRRFLVPFNLVSQNDGNFAEDLVEQSNQEKRRGYTKTWRGDILNVKEVKNQLKIPSYARYKIAPLDWNKIY